MAQCCPTLDYVLNLLCAGSIITPFFVNMTAPVIVIARAHQSIPEPPPYCQNLLDCDLAALRYLVEAAKQLTVDPPRPNTRTSCSACTAAAQQQHLQLFKNSSCTKHHLLLCQVCLLVA